MCLLTITIVWSVSEPKTKWFVLTWKTVKSFESIKLIDKEISKDFFNLFHKCTPEVMYTSKYETINNKVLISEIRIILSDRQK